MSPFIPTGSRGQLARRAYAAVSPGASTRVARSGFGAPGRKLSKRPAFAAVLAAALLAAPPAARADVVVFTQDTVIGDGDVQYDGEDIIVRGCTVTINGGHTFNSLTIERNASNYPGVVTHTAGFTNGSVCGFYLTIAGDVVIQGADGNLVASRVDVGGKGYGSAEGPGQGGNSYTGGAGAGYGGEGGISFYSAPGGPTYGFIAMPLDLGSGGGRATIYNVPGGAGGGAVALTVDGTLQLDGALAARGNNGGFTMGYGGGGGSGGSIYVIAGTLAGNGAISADGGNAGEAQAGGGGGGRIAIYCDVLTFAGSMSAFAGNGYQRGGAGTVYGEHSQSAPDLTTDAGGPTLGAPTPVSDLSLLGSLTVANGADARVSGLDAIEGGLSITNQAVAWFGDALTTGGHMTLSNGGAAHFRDLLVVEGNLTLDGNALVELWKLALVTQNVLLSEGSTLTHTPGVPGMQLIVWGNMTIDGGSQVSADGAGYGSAAGPGSGGDSYTGGAGGGYGGAGGGSFYGAPGGPTYGSIAMPFDLGSGGGRATIYNVPGGAGGGAVALAIDGTLELDGALTARGNSGGFTMGYGGGGGSGGSIYVITGTLAGNGAILADGGDAGDLIWAGGGGGGRIAIYCCAQGGELMARACGGAGYENGHDGTIFDGSPFIEITQQPQSQIAFFGQPAGFHVEASTTQGTLRYQWRKDDVNLQDTGHYSGVTTATLQIDAASYDDNGYYDVWLTDDCGDLVSDKASMNVLLTGDLNCDGHINFGDINPFVLILSDPAEWQSTYPNCPPLNGDMNCDDHVNFGDINPFVSCLANGDCDCP